MRGTRDFYPEEMRVRNYIFDAWHRGALTFGFEEYDGPCLEHLELYTRKSGEEIGAQLYHFKDKSDRDLALRPEITPTLARLVNQKGRSLRHPVKWFSMPRLFRYERSMRGRLREFFQLNMDILGAAEVEADAELMAAMIHILRSLGLGAGDFEVQVSSRALYNCLFQDMGFTADRIGALYAVLDKKDKMDAAAYRDFFLGKGFSASDFDAVYNLFSCSALEEIKVPASGQAPLDDLKKLFDLMDAYGLADYVRFNPTVVRGLAYYTGIVFEVFDRGRELRAIAGGGRFDNLLQALGGAPLPATGFGMGDVVLLELLTEKQRVPQLSKGLDVFFVGVEPFEYKDLILAAGEFRSHGLCVEFGFKPQNIKKQMTQANQNNARFVIFLGGEEALQGNVRLKNMLDGQEELLDLAEARKRILLSNRLDVN